MVLVSLPSESRHIHRAQFIVTASSLGANCQAVYQYQMPSLSQETASYFCTCQGSGMNDSRKTFMINHNKSELHYAGIELGSLYSWSNAV